MAFTTVSRLAFIVAVTVVVMAASALPVSADPGNGGGWGQGDGGGRHHGAPGPVIGDGLPAFLLIGGGVYLFLRRSRGKSA